MPNDFHSLHLNPLYSLYAQICTEPRNGFTCRQLVQFLHKSLNVGQTEFVTRQKIQAVALHSFYKLDRNQDGTVTTEDLMVLQQKLRRMLAPTPSQDVETIRSAASAKFRSISHEGKLHQPIIQAYFYQRLPKVLPLRSLISQMASLILIEMTTDGPLPTRERHITEEQWINTAIRLL